MKHTYTIPEKTIRMAISASLREWHGHDVPADALRFTMDSAGLTATATLDATEHQAKLLRELV